jgi:heme-degrading monooxygenase HmoA
MSGRVASFHLVRFRPWQAPAATARLALDRPALHGTPGLRFFRLLGTGRGTTTRASIDLRRTAMFAVWEDDDALDDFLATSPVGRRWAAAQEAYHVRLALLGGHGRWRGVDVLDGLTPGSGGGPVAVLTRATVRTTRWPRFLRAGVAVSGALQGAGGLLAAAGIGEAPLGRQATFSLWSSAAAMRAFADADPYHHDVVRRTRAEGWYGEELFARFAPYSSQGTWSGQDPLVVSRAR